MEGMLIKPIFMLMVDYLISRSASAYRSFFLLLPLQPRGINPNLRSSFSIPRGIYGLY